MSGYKFQKIYFLSEAFFTLTSSVDPVEMVPVYAGNISNESVHSHVGEDVLI